MSLKTVLRTSRPVTLIPDSGLQFLDFAVDSRDRGLPGDWDCHDRVRKGSMPAPGEMALVRRDDEPLSQEVADFEVHYSVSRREVFEMFARQWVPMPLFRRDGKRFFRGPTNWARALLVPLDGQDDGGCDHRLVLAVDTALMAFVEDRPYLAPSPDDAAAGLPFALASAREALDFFLGEEWMQLWLSELYTEMLESARRQQSGRQAEMLSEEEVHEELQGGAEPLLRYAALVDFIDRAGVLPEVVRMVDTTTGRRARHVDCDLVIDVGNSRTCGLVIERDPETGADVSQAAKLELRDLTAPEHVYSDPFESRVEFAQAHIGRSDLSQRSGRSDAFEWPTIARVGHEAARLAGTREGNEGNTGLSSPKRYLWSTEPATQPWRFNLDTVRHDAVQFAMQGDFVKLINDAGTPLHTLAPDDPERMVVWEPLYSRSSLFSFALAEMLTHAIAMINSAAYRQDRPNGDNPRRLARVILTVPSALPLAERAILRERAEHARDLVYLALGLARPAAAGEAGEHVRGGIAWRTDGAIRPDVSLEWDEASATQVVYLYTQIARNFAGHARDFVDTVRRPENRAASEDDDAGLRVATLDIGGGTTDLVITGIACQGRGTSVTIVPRQMFREGFNVAGDLLVRAVVRAHVLRPIEEAIERAGVRSGSSVVNELFGGNRGDMSLADQVRREAFSTQIAVPIALGLLHQFEESGFGVPSEPDTAFASFFGEDIQPAPALIDHVNAEVAKRGGPRFDLRDVDFPYDAAELDRTVRSVMQPVLDPLAEIVWHYRADVLLLSGRPSRLPPVAQLLRESLPMMAGRIVPMHRFRTGNWYPFRDDEARIHDPKTTATVGAMLCALAGGSLPFFNFRSDELRSTKSTARFIGKLDGAGHIPDEDVAYAGVDLSDPHADLPDGEIEFRGVMALGFRQLPVARWPATRLYTLDYASDEARRELHQRTPLTVRLKRRAGRRKDADLLSEHLEIADAVESRDGRQVRSKLKLRLQTLESHDGFWLDTGVLVDA